MMGYPCMLLYHQYIATECFVKKYIYIKKIYIKKNQITGVYFISCGMTTGPIVLSPKIVLVRVRTTKFNIDALTQVLSFTAATVVKVIPLL